LHLILIKNLIYIIIVPLSVTASL